MKMKEIAVALLLAGLCFADFVIPPDQPVCRLYGMIQILGTVGGILVAAYAGFSLASSHDQTQKDANKALLAGVIVGLIIVWMAPLLVKYLVNSAAICGW